MKYYFFLQFILFNIFQSFSQIDTSHYSSPQIEYKIERHIALVTGINVHKNFFAEAGIAIKDNGVAGHHPITRVLALTSEFKFTDKFIYAPKAGVWLGGGASGMNLGINLIYYSDSEKGTLRCRPEIGLGFDAFRVVYGYNIAITQKNFQNVNKHNFCLNFLINLKKIKDVKR
ncbi:hypothetical protein [Sporocytophaga myxococcoides]|uniref:hypothetical protein n=1 Tax=Sporocytophaga myxococcoides TaxID=153721 RepID=UPI0004226252|nr:hypothetical protein [Sporocytophaga myxococcoides]